jgi:hypothetical protein
LKPAGGLLAGKKPYSTLDTTTFETACGCFETAYGCFETGRACLTESGFCRYSVIAIYKLNLFLLC